MSRKKRYKIHYVPGMISLIFLPILCIWFLKKNYYEERCMPINMPSKYDPNKPKGVVRFDTTCLSDPENRRIYTTFKFDGDAMVDKANLAASVALLKQIANTQDTINGVHFVLGNNAKYETFIEILDLCAYTESLSLYIPMYIAYENEIWYIHPKIKDARKRPQRQYQDNVAYASTPAEKEQFTDKISTFFHDENIIKMKYFFLVFFLFSAISIFYTWNNFIKGSKKSKGYSKSRSIPLFDVASDLHSVWK